MLTTMRVAVVSECFLPQVNGVTNTVARVVTHLRHRGHEVLVVTPGAGPTQFGDVAVVRVRGVPLPGYASVSVGLPCRRLARVLRAFRPDVVHLAGPFAFGAFGGAVAADLGLPRVAVYQTDFAGFAAHYRLRPAAGAARAWTARIHRRASLTLVPSSSAACSLLAQGVQRVRRWGRGVDAEAFHPRRRSQALRTRLAPEGELLVGYVGRLAHEKRVGLLGVLRDVPGCRVVVVGDGPERRRLERRLPFATFLGFQFGSVLAETFASLDVFVHTGANETFCQTVQEALASGVPAVVPAAGGPLDLVRHGENGLLWEPDDPDALRRTVASLAADPDLRRALAAHARRSVAGRSWEIVGDQLIGHYESVL